VRHLSEDTRRRLALGALTLLAVVQLPIALRRMAEWNYNALVRPGYSDFGSLYLYGWIGWHYGWNRLYDVDLQLRVWLQMGGTNYAPFYPNLYPPFTAWIAAPFALLPFRLAWALWLLFVLALFIGIWKLAVPGQRGVRWTHLAAVLALYPVVLALMLGQPAVLSTAALVLGWWLLHKDRPVLAGMVLALALIKPQIGFLVPAVLIVSGRWKTTVSWLATVTVLASLSLFSLGLDGVRQFVNHVAHVRDSTPPTTPMTIQDLLGWGPLAFGVEAAIVGLVLVIAYRRRHEGIHLPFAAALVGSLVVAPYAQPPNLLALVAAAWISLNATTTIWSRRVLLAGYALLVIPSIVVVPSAAAIFTTLLIPVAIGWLVFTSASAPVDRPQLASSIAA
jgi:hypothetical protein